MRKKFKRGNRKSEIIAETSNILASTYQTLPERIRFLRARSKPYMTQMQLAHRAGVTQETISELENADPSHINMELNTLRRIAHALGCKIYINIKSRPSPLSKACQPLGHTLPPLPEWSGKMTERDHKMAARYGSYPWKKVPPAKYRPRPGRLFYKQGSEPGSSEEPTE